MKLKVEKEILEETYIMGLQRSLVPKYRITDGTKIWDEFYSALKRPYSNFKRNSEKKLVLWGCMNDLKRGFYPITSNDYLVGYFVGVEVFNDTSFPPFETYRIPKCTMLKTVLTNKQFKLEYSKYIKEMKKFMEKNDLIIVGPIQEKYEDDLVTLYFPIEIISR